VTWQADQIRTTSLYIPAFLLSTIIYLGFSYELLSAVGLGINPLLALAIGKLSISFQFTNLLLIDGISRFNTDWSGFTIHYGEYFLQGMTIALKAYIRSSLLTVSASLACRIHS
jgi:hypothetical protein